MTASRSRLIVEDMSVVYVAAGHRIPAVTQVSLTVEPGQALGIVNTLTGSHPFFVERVGEFHRLDCSAVYFRLRSSEIGRRWRIFGCIVRFLFRGAGEKRISKKVVSAVVLPVMM